MTLSGFHRFKSSFFADSPAATASVGSSDPPVAMAAPSTASSSSASVGAPAAVVSTSGSSSSSSTPSSGPAGTKNVSPASTENRVGDGGGDEGGASYDGVSLLGRFGLSSKCASRGATAANEAGPPCSIPEEIETRNDNR